MENRGLERYAPLAGVVFLVLIIVSFIVSGEPPDTDDGAAEAVEYWTDNDSQQVAGSVIAAIAAVALVWFGGSLRELLLRAGADRLAALAFAGLVIVATGIGVDSSLRFAAAESVGDVSPDVTHTITALFSYFFFPFTIGFAVTLLATA
ncbi:MAG TPA: hypothetical protein VHF89_13550, partial [Solirubrobacteraceae bacterium]|nr:hypothetical protein [Solirubrobacteraceae bacterium]